MQRILPAYPLFVKDPNFSFWSSGEILNAQNVETWWGEKKKIYGFLKTEGKTYCFMGNAADFASCGAVAAEQLSLSVTAFSTDYSFRAGELTLKLRFVSPLPPDDLNLLSLPVCYVEYEIEGMADAEISFFVNRNVAYNDSERGNCAVKDKSVRGGVMALNGFEAAFLGLKRQLPLSNNDDAIGADWGYFYLSGESAYYADETSVAAYLSGDRREFGSVGEEKYLVSLNRGEQGAVMLGYDDVAAIDYFGDFLKGYYLEKHTITEALEYVYKNREGIDGGLSAFDEDLKLRAAKYGKEYLNVLYASLRQSVGAHKLVRDREGNALFLSKECCSNGCIATVDVSYPSMPLYLLYQPELVKGMMRPILKFARMPVWTYDFAPHDAGTYPACCGQVYGLNEEKTRFHGNCFKDGYKQTHFPIYLLPASFDAYDFDMQMPVEECANLLVMFLACYRFDGDIGFFRESYDLSEKWVDYLVKYGLKPENQLCTDDFAGHLKNNLNLSIKACVGIAAFAELSVAAGHAETGAEYRRIAESYAAEIVAFGEDKTHLPLTWDESDETFSLKYNLAFDKLLGLGLFPQAVLEKEVDCYAEKCAAFGTPLDCRREYSKSDWLIWAASLTDDTEKKKIFIRALDSFLRESPDRVPFSDWYETVGGEYHCFRARTVQGGCFFLLLEDKQ